MDKKVKENINLLPKRKKFDFLKDKSYSLRLENKREEEFGLQLLIIRKIHTIETLEALVYLYKKLKDNNIIFYVERSTIQEAIDLNLNLKNEKLLELEEKNFIIFDCEKHELDIDLIITIGGDGTILWTVSLFQKRDVPPIIGISKGTLGFLANFMMNEIDMIAEQMIKEALIARKIDVEKRTRVYVELRSKGKEVRNRFNSFNEVILSRGPNPLPIEVEIFLNDEYISTSIEDGVLITTPTGSTAYALSAGGPIIQTDVPSLLILPINPKSLSFKPLILPNDVEIKLKLSPKNRNNGFLSGDGRNQLEVFLDEEVILKKSDFKVNIVVHDPSKRIEYWMDKLKNLLSWNNNFSYSKGKL